jgi:hypothetical protein
MVGTIAVASILLTAGQEVGSIKPVTVRTTDAKQATVPDPKAKATVLVFLLTDCPIANRYAPELKRIEADYAKKDVAFFRVYVYPEATAESIAQHTKDYAYKWPAVHDRSHALVKALDAKVTPEAAVVLRDGTVVYRGRIDDMYVEHGRLREGDFRHDLRIALDEALAGKPVTLARTTAYGCFIPRG